MIDIRVRFSKTDQEGRGTTLRIICNMTGPLTSICPFVAMRVFLAQRGSHPGQLFCHFDKSPLTRYQVQKILQKSLCLLGHDGMNFNTHSFRIGAATSASMSVPSEKTKRNGSLELRRL
jgi:hypothetical protein